MIHRATEADHDWIRTTAAAVYRALGDYGTIIPSWLAHTGVLSFVDTAGGGQRRGFILVGFYTADESITGRDDGAWTADLLAIAVAPEHQRQGVGKGLLCYALEVARAAGTERCVTEIRLTVSDGNTVARSMFDKAGFSVIDDDFGSYDGGQRAIRMRRAIEPARAGPTRSS